MEGEWILLDYINYAPQEIEGLMSLLEEKPTLKIYDSDPILFFTKDSINEKDEKTCLITKDIINEKDEKAYLIHPNFRLFITSSNITNISSAIKSRCLFIKMRPFKEAKDYAELISNSLINTGISDKNINEISKKKVMLLICLKKKKNNQIIY